ncbi:class F sortase [Nocardioides sp. Iso805N]|uniref:class F sortase n=1 Tax=Nocardioides sp. Iso805N TaxID=1283287 RepID=UPI0003A59905|nr:class F sortase [Nocardioides sp. Iso805N]
MAGTRVRLEPGVLPATNVLTRMRVQNDTGQRFVAPSVGLNVPLGALTMVDDNITPPGITSAYLVRNLGVQPGRAKDGTVFVVMHSVHGGGIGAGDYLVDLAHGGSALKTGAIIDVGGVRYRVTGSMSLPKTQVPDRSDIWADTPGRVVVITCLQNPDGTPATRNLIVEGHEIAP